MQSVGIITFQNSQNCGSMLQAFALQHVLTRRFDTDCKLINFSNPGQQGMYSPFWRVDGPKQVVKNALWATVYPKILRQIESYCSFKNEYLDETDDPISDSSDLVSLNSAFDKFITGSDQVWNIRCMDADDAYYLSFVEDDAKKYAYAVSFGANNPFESERGETFRRYVSSFHRVSVREHNAQKWIKRAISRDVDLCLDPTMLLDQKAWEDSVSFGEEPIIKGRYIFYYCFSINQRIARFLHAVSKKLDMPVYYFDPKEWALRCCWKNGIRLVPEFGPLAFLNYMRHAEVIFTTSFHGTAFSTLFHKTFWYISPDSSGQTADDRATSFLSQLGLMDRYRTTKDLLGTDLKNSPDYAHVEELLAVLRSHSLAYLESIVDD